MNEDSGITPREHFIKQRRNLILISLLVVFMHAAHLTFGKQVSFLGFGVLISNPDIIPKFLILMFCYFSWRYFTALNATDELYKLSKRVDVACEKGARLSFIKHVCHKAKVNQSQFSFNAAFYDDEFLFPRKVYRFDMEVYDRPGNSLSHEQKNILHSIGTYEIKGWRVVWMRVYNFLFTVVKYPEFSECIFPVLLALLAFLEICGLQVVEKILSYSF